MTILMVFMLLGWQVMGENPPQAKQLAAGNGEDKVKTNSNKFWN